MRSWHLPAAAEVVADPYLGPDIPGAVRLRFDFGYRMKVNADAIAQRGVYAQWDDHLNPKTAELRGPRRDGRGGPENHEVPMPANSRPPWLTTGAPGRRGRYAGPWSTCSKRMACKYLVLVNDNRAYDQRTGKYRATWRSSYPRRRPVTLRSWPGTPYAYDMLQRKSLRGDAGRRWLQLQSRPDRAGRHDRGTLSSPAGEGGDRDPRGRQARLAVHRFRDHSRRPGPRHRPGSSRCASASPTPTAARPSIPTTYCRERPVAALPDAGHQ